MKMYYFETLNPRKACAVAKHLKSPVEYIKLDGNKREQRSPEHLARNPNGKVPVLVDGDQRIWESVAIMIWLSNKAGSNLWPTQDTSEQLEVMRWISWDAFHFTPHASAFYFEHHIKDMFKLGAPDQAALDAKAPLFHQNAKVLDAHLAGREFVAADHLTIADFCLAATLPYAEKIHLPWQEYQNIQRWHAGLMKLPAWCDPFPA